MTELHIHKTFRDSHFCFHVHTNDQKVLDLLENYLDFRHTEKKFTPFFEFTYNISYFNRNTLKREDKAIYTTFKESDEKLCTLLNEKVSEVKINLNTMVISADLFSLSYDMGIMDFAFLQPCRTILTYRNWIYVHGAHVQSATHDFIFTGPSGAGKSSLAYTLGMQNNYCLQSDDEVFIHTDQKHNFCLPFPTKIGFKNKILEKNMRDKQGMGTIYGNKKRFALPISDENFTDIVARKTVIILPHYEENATSLTLHPINNEDTLQAIAPLSLSMSNIRQWVKQRQEAMFTLLTFIKRSETYRLTYNDRLLNDLPALIAKR